MKKIFFSLLVISVAFFVSYKDTQASPTCDEVVSYGGQNYTTVQIGTQCWFSQNLNVGDMLIDKTIHQSNNGIKEKYCYSSIQANCDKYGGLYQWDEAMNYSPACNGVDENQPACSSPVQGICPVGWHIPSHYELTALERAVCTSDTCAIDFPYDITTKWNWFGTDESAKLQTGGSSGFEFLPAGYWNHFTAYFEGITNGAFMWSSSQYDNNYAWVRLFRNTETGLYRGYEEKTYGLVVRCVSNSPYTVTSPTVSILDATSVTSNEAILNGSIVATGGQSSSVRGFEYGITTDYGSTLAENGDFSKGPFNLSATGLLPSTTYHFRAFATNSYGTSYSTDKVFTTLKKAAAINLIGVADDAKKVSLSWTASPDSGLILFNVKNITDDTDSGWIKKDNYVFKKLKPKTIYQFKVDAKNKKGTITASSDIISVSTPVK